MVDIHLCQKHIDRGIIDLAKLIQLSESTLHILQFGNDIIKHLLRGNLLREPTRLMHGSIIKRYIAEEIKEEIVVECAICTKLCHRGGILLYYLILKESVAGCNAGECTVPCSVKKVNLAMELMLMSGHIEVAPTDTYTIRDTPQIGCHIRKIGKTKPTPHKIAE